MDREEITKAIEALRSTDVATVRNTMSILTPVVINTADEQTVREILGTVEQVTSERWYGNMDISTVRIPLTDACEDKLAALASVPALLEQLVHKNAKVNERAFVQLMKVVGSTDNETVLQQVLQKLESSRIDTFSQSMLNGTNLERVKRICREKLGLPTDEKRMPVPAANGKGPVKQRIG